MSNKTQAKRIFKIEQAMFSRMPEWAKEAYYNDRTIHSVVRIGLMRGAGTEEIIWNICETLFEERNRWRKIASDIQSVAPSVVVIQKEEKC